MHHPQVLTPTALTTVHRTVGDVLAFEERIDAAEREFYPTERVGSHYYFRRGARDAAAGHEPRTYRDAFAQVDYDRGYRWAAKEREQGRVGGIR